MKIIIKYIIITSFLIIISFASTASYARYISNANGEDEVRIAKYGELYLTETYNGIEEINNNESLELKLINVNPGENIDKKISISFTDSEVSTYIFFVIETNRWSVDELNSEVAMRNGNSKLLNFTISNNWFYLNNEMIENDVNGLTKRFIFYYDYDINNINEDSIEVFNGINTNTITYNDIDIINDSILTFKTYSIQKNDGLTPEEAWEFLEK